MSPHDEERGLHMHLPSFRLPSTRKHTKAGGPLRRHARTLSVVATLITGAALIFGATSANATPVITNSLYLDRTAPVPDRVESLLRQMTLAEKIGQMDQIVTGQLRDATNPANGQCTNAGGDHDPLQTNCLDNVLVKN